MPRLDQEIVARGLLPTRARARDAVLRGEVLVEGAVVDRPAANVGRTTTIALTDPAAAYVSRAALKLIHGLDHFGYDPAGRVALDIGASTGGFTEVLLRRKAARVFAIDVGHDQLAPSLRNHRRVTARDGLNARDLVADDLGEPFTVLTSDVSFISQRLVLPPALAMAEPGTLAIVLAKPQFEVGREGLGKGGVVRDAELAERSGADLADWLAAQDGWSVDGIVPSPVLGGSGNREFLIGARKR